MNKIKFYFGIFSILIAGIFAFSISAHQPRIVSGPEITEIKNPEVSQAFYGELKGSAEFFKIDLEEGQEIYFGILVPDLSDSQKNFSLEISSDRGFSYFLEGLEYQWKYFYEEFAGDSYFQGPEQKIGLDRGVYLIKVFNPENRGKYVLVVGQKEEFPLPEILNTIKVLPRLKKDFFRKSVFISFFNRIGLFIFGPVFLLLVVVILIIVYTKKQRNKKKQHYEDLGH